MIRIGVLGSTRGTDLQAILDAINSKQLDSNLSVVISNKKTAFIKSGLNQLLYLILVYGYYKINFLNLNWCD